MRAYIALLKEEKGFPDLMHRVRYGLELLFKVAVPPDSFGPCGKFIQKRLASLRKLQCDVFSERWGDIPGADLISFRNGQKIIAHRLIIIELSRIMKILSDCKTKDDELAIQTACFDFLLCLIEYWKVPVKYQEEFITALFGVVRESPDNQHGGKLNDTIVRKFGVPAKS